jgi:hypothetical protein
LARASALHAEGHRFDSDILHKRKPKAVSQKLKAKANKQRSSFKLVM